MVSIRSVELARVTFKKPFSSASGSCAEKSTVVIKFDDGIPWELTWSPSMGVSPKGVYGALEKGEGSSQEMAFIESHLRWAMALGKASPRLSGGTLYGEEIGVSEVPPKLKKGLDLLRVKCRGSIPEWLYSHPVPANLILDYNASADRERIEGEVFRLLKVHSDANIYIEQPFKNEVLHCAGVKPVLDTENYADLIRRDQIPKNAVVTLKFGRNTTAEYKALLDMRIPCQFGSVLCTKQAYESVLYANRTLGQLDVRILYRDGVKIEKAIEPSSVVILSETNAVSDYWNRLLWEMH